MTEADGIIHPGIFIRADIIPSGMSVTKAAQLIGVGRPALSNLLNGKAALSPEMATRIEKAFNHSRADLLARQARYDASLATNRAAPATTKQYVPPFLLIKANDVERWVSHNIPARSRLSVFLRTLVHSTGGALTKVDFPGNDDAERPGWDGVVEADEGTPWVPAGRSGWEFGTNEDPKTKAEADFKKSVDALDAGDRANTTFVFVTPRRWPGKIAWAASKQAGSFWKEVRAYDASDIEQWLEQSIAAQTWFANETHLPANVRTLDRCWADWAEVCTPHMEGAFFGSAIEAARRIILSRLTKPPERPILIAADSTDEALAFLAQLFSGRGGEELASYRHRVLVFDTAGILPRLVTSAPAFIPVIFERDVEREFARHSTSLHSIVVYPRNAGIVEPDLVLEPISHEAFNAALEAMGKSRDEIARLADASGRSLTVLRRQLSTVPAVRAPTWSSDPDTSARLVPFLLVGAWDSQNTTDREGLSLLARSRSYDDLEKDFQSLLQLDDAPVWSVGRYRGVVSKIDLLHSIHRSISAADLSHYYSMARMVLGEDDPALDLEEGQRWAASIHGKVREFSATFRKSISETLVLLAVYGQPVLRSSLGIDTEIEAEGIVRGLLPSPLTTRVLEANDRDLPTYAEAAPDAFLSILENDLKTKDPAVFGLLRPAKSGIFGGSISRTGLLWALEGLSWSPITLARSASILAQLSQIEITDNWINKPINSLAAIFRAWMPQTAASSRERIRLIKRLAKTFPDAAWTVCLAQFDNYGQAGHYSHKPRWRPDGYGFGEPIPILEPIIGFTREMVELALNWEGHSLKMLCDLVERLINLSETDRSRVWDLVKNWAETRASDVDKAAMREKVRVSTLSRRAALRIRNNPDALGFVVAAKAVYAALEPTDVLNKHAWLFRDGWVEESADEIESLERFDFERRNERIKELRIGALREAVDQSGLAGILKLSERGNASWVIGALAAQALPTKQDLQRLLILALAAIVAGEGEVYNSKRLIGGALLALPDDGVREAFISEMIKDLPVAHIVVLLVLAPFNRSVWKLVDNLDAADQEQYWREVRPDWIHQAPDEVHESVERLLRANRPCAAFWCIRLEPEKIDALALSRVLEAVAQGGDEQLDGYKIDQYDVEKAFEHLNRSEAISSDQKAALEFAYVDVLARPWDRRGNYGIPNLERYIEDHPELFVQAITWVYKRKGGGNDPVDLQIPPDRVQSLADRGYKLLEGLNRIPGNNDLGELESDRLTKWITTVRQSASDLDRSDVADVCIGKLFSCAPSGADGVWPCEAVRDLMEEIQSDAVMEGTRAGVFNARGVVTRSHGEGGAQEKEIAAKYHRWADALQFSHPFVSAKLLRSLSKTYEYQANREDTEVSILRRLH